MLYTLPLSTAFTITTTAASIDVRGEEIRLGQLPNFAHPRLTYNNARCQDINRDYHDLHLLMWNFSSFLIAYCCISNIILPFLLHPSSPHVHIFTGLIQNLGSFPIGRALAADPPLPLAWTLMIITVISIHRNRGKTRQRVELQYVVAQVRIKQQTTECFTDVLSLLARDSDSCCWDGRAILQSRVVKRWGRSVFGRDSKRSARSRSLWYQKNENVGLHFCRRHGSSFNQFNVVGSQSYILLWVKWRKITAVKRFRVVQGHHFRY